MKVRILKDFYINDKKFKQSEIVDFEYNVEIFEKFGLVIRLELDSLSFNDLKYLARKNNIKLRRNMKKEDILKLLKEKRNGI